MPGNHWNSSGCCLISRNALLRLTVQVGCLTSRSGSKATIANPLKLAVVSSQARTPNFEKSWSSLRFSFVAPVSSCLQIATAGLQHLHKRVTTRTNSYWFSCWTAQPGHYSTVVRWRKLSSVLGFQSYVVALCGCLFCSHSLAFA